MFQLDLLHIFQINFEVRLNMFATKKDNLSVDNHAVIDNWFIQTNYLPVRYKKNNGKLGDTIINDCDTWIFFGNTMSQGKKNDHVFHNSCFTYLINLYDNKQAEGGKSKIPFNVCHIDNCAGQ